MRKKLAAHTAWSNKGGGSQRTVRCERGQLWVTLERDPRDHCLRQGQCQVFAPGGRLVVVALQDAVVSVETLPPLQHRLRSLLRRLVLRQRGRGRRAVRLQR